MKFFIKFLVNIFQFFFFFIIIIKTYSSFFLSLYTLKFELFFNLDYNIELLLFILITIYFRYILSLVYENKNSCMFFYTIKFINSILFCYNYGFLLYFKNIYKNFMRKIIIFINNYWKFRIKINPIKKNLKFKFHSIYDKTVQNNEKQQEQQKQKNHEDWLKNYKNNNKDEKHIEMLKKRKPNTYKKNNTFQSANTTKQNNFSKKPSKNKIKHPTKNKINFYNFETFLKYVLNNKKNNFFKILLNIINILFFIFDIIITIFTNFIYLFPNIIWKPLNIRLPYYKKINNSNLRKKKFSQYNKIFKSCNKIYTRPKIKINLKIINFKKYLKKKM